MGWVPLVDGHRVLPERLPEPLRAALVRDASRYEFTPPHPRAGGAFAMASLREGSAPRAVRDWITVVVGEQGMGGVVPDEASYQRYTPSGNGLPPHRDQRYYTGRIVIMTLEGRARFAVHGSRDPADVVTEWVTTAGEVIVLDGWAPGQEGDPRPYHRIDPPVDGPRLMLQLRHLDATLTDLTEAEMQQAHELRRTPEAPRRPGA